MSVSFELEVSWRSVINVWQGDIWVNLGTSSHTDGDLFEGTSRLLSVLTRPTRRIVHHFIWIYCKETSFVKFYDRFTLAPPEDGSLRRVANLTMPAKIYYGKSFTDNCGVVWWYRTEIGYFPIETQWKTYNFFFIRGTYGPKTSRELRHVGAIRRLPITGSLFQFSRKQFV